MANRIVQGYNDTYVGPARNAFAEGITAAMDRNHLHIGHMVAPLVFLANGLRTVMDSIVKGQKSPLATTTRRPDRREAEEAVRTLIAWAGDNPNREGLIDTPSRVVDAFEEWFSGYDKDPADYLNCTFDDTQGYDDMVILRNIAVISHCEHHLAPFLGTACVAYIPLRAVVGLSKLARVVEVFARRLQTQETMTLQICQAVQTILKPAGVAVKIDAIHQCMTTRGVSHPNVDTVTTRFSGVFKEQSELRDRFFQLSER